MSDETSETPTSLLPPDDLTASPPPAAAADDSAADPLLSSRLNARAPEYVPRTGGHQDKRSSSSITRPFQHHYHPPQHRPPPPPPRMMQIPHHGPPPPPPPPMIHMFPQHGTGFHAPLPAAVPGHHVFAGGERFGEHDGGGGDGGGDSEEGFGLGSPVIGGLSDDLVHKVTKQVEYYFSDVNLATTEHLMRFISKDAEGFVPITVIGSFKKIKAFVNNNAQLATALQSSRKLVVSDDGKKVKRRKPITDSDLEELQSRIIVAENLPEDHCYQSLVKVFSVVGSVKSIRTCYPQNSNAAAAANPRPGKMDTYLFNRLHAFVEYETTEQAERAVVELNAEGTWRSGLRVRLLSNCMKLGQNRGKKSGYEGDGMFEGDVSSSKNPNENQLEDNLQAIDLSQEETGDDGYNDEGVARRGRGRGRGGRGRGRGMHHHNRGPASATQAHSVQSEQHVATKPPGPRMPDGTRGFTMGRGKPLENTELLPPLV